MSCSEVTIIVKDSEKTLKTKHLVYEDFHMNENDPIINKFIQECIKNFGSHDVTDVVVKASFVVR